MDNDEFLERSVGELLERWPEAIPVLIRRKMSCVGCSMARFDSLQDVAATYNIDPQLFLDELHQTLHLVHREDPK
jgi:hybrid cluster-associated redox disulfide protein